MPTLSPELVTQHHTAIEAPHGPVFAFCRSGTASTVLWALTQGVSTGTLFRCDIRSRAAGVRFIRGTIAGRVQKDGEDGAASPIRAEAIKYAGARKVYRRSRSFTSRKKALVLGKEDSGRTCGQDLQVFRPFRQAGD